MSSSSTLTTEKDRSSSSTRIKKSEESGGLSEKIDRKGERERRKEATEVIENLNLRSLETKTGRSRSASGREEVRKKEEDTMAVIRENIYLHKPGLEAWPGPPVPSASWLSSSASPSSPSATLPTMGRSKGTIRGQGALIRSGDQHCYWDLTQGGKLYDCRNILLCFWDNICEGRRSGGRHGPAAANGRTEYSPNLNTA